VRLSYILCILILSLLCGCSSFERDWQSRLGVEPGPPPTGLWEGTWLSRHNNHTGNLRCIVDSAEDGNHSWRYKATYAGFFTFEYTVLMQVRFDDDTAHFQGEADLGNFAGGVYKYSGQANESTLKSTYKAKSDHGVFEMNRIIIAKEEPHE